MDRTLLAHELRRARGAIRRRLRERFPPPNGVPADGRNITTMMLDDAGLWPLRELYEGSYAAPPISYATVRDYADSTENMGGLASAAADMKNVQRCWMVKVVLGNVPRGGRLLEIGAGEPLVAGLLARLGYDLTIVDPYDGSGGGPVEYQWFKALYPDLRFVRDRFPPGEPLAGEYDAVYSISVLEHVPHDAIAGVIEAAASLVAPRAGCSIHAVDHVIAGWGADTHRAGLERIVDAAGLDRAMLDEQLAAMEGDPETYLVSAESHNLWRGAVPYESYPMRRIGSVNLFSRPG